MRRRRSIVYRILTIDAEIARLPEALRAYVAKAAAEYRRRTSR